MKCLTTSNPKRRKTYEPHHALKHLTALLCAAVTIAWTIAGELAPSAGPGDPASQMYTTTDIYNRLDTGMVGTKATTFPEPNAGPAIQGRTLDEIMAKSPVKDDANGANPAQVFLGKTYWGLTSTGWGLKTGTLPNNGAMTITPSTASQTIPAGYHNGSGTVLGDEYLASGNIKSGVSIFNVTGSYVLPPVEPILMAKTGQTSTVPIAAPAGSDGALQKGTDWPVPRFTDNGDGTVTDNFTKLIWTKNANPCGLKNFWDASTYCAALGNGTAGLSDGSKAGDWRLPNVQELRNLCDYAFYSPALSNAAGTGKWTEGDPFTAVQNNCWSNSTYVSVIELAWYVSLDSGLVNNSNKTVSYYYVWPVR